MIDRTCDFSLKRCLEHGSEFWVCFFDEIMLGVMVCCDREYPESNRVMILKGAEWLLALNDCGSTSPRSRTGNQSL